MGFISRREDTFPMQPADTVRVRRVLYNYAVHFVSCPLAIHPVLTNKYCTKCTVDLSVLR